MNLCCIISILAFSVDNETCLGFPLGVETGAIQDQQMNASSSFNETTLPRQARLAKPGAWCPKQVPAHLKIDLVILHSICAVATQGFFEQGYFTTQYWIRLGTGNLTELYADAKRGKVIYFISNTVKPLLSGPPIKRTPSITRTHILVRKLASS